MEYTNSRIRDIIGEYIHSERDRMILIRRLADGLTIDRLAAEFDMSASQIKRILYKNQSIVFSHFDKDMKLR